MNSEFVELILKCGSWQEAEKIAGALLKKHLVACVEFLEVKSKYHWQSKLEEAHGIKLVMETVSSNFDKIEAEVSKLHSYDTFVLQQIPITNLSKKAQAWLEQETKSKD
jgi:periplasmic divalent cation tolerance protein